MTCVFCLLPLDNCDCDSRRQDEKDHTPDSGTEASVRNMLAALCVRGEG